MFFEDDDYRAFLFRLGLGLGFEKKELEHELLFFPKSRVRLSAKKGMFNLHGFCLMPNHFHLLIEQQNKVPISNLMLRICTSFSMFLNKKYKRVGHIFQDQFKAVAVESDRQLRWLCSYIHMNPVKSGLVDEPEEYKWSSFKDFVGQRELPIISKNLFPGMFGNKKDFAREVRGVKIEDLEIADLDF